MTGPTDADVRELLAELDRQNQELTALRAKLAELTESASSPNRALSVTVNGIGVVTKIEFPTRAFRTMAPAELGQQLVELIAKAREAAAKSAAALPEMPSVPGFSYDSALDGQVDLTEVFAPAVDLMREAAKHAPAHRPLDW